MRVNIKSSTSNNNLNNNSNSHARLDSSSSINKIARQLECNKSIDSIEKDGDEQSLDGSGGGPSRGGVVASGGITTGGANTSGTSSGGGDQKKSIKRNTSLISFKSLDFSIKTIYSSMKGKHSSNSNKHHDSGSGSGGTSEKNTATSSKTSIVTKAPYVRVETVDKDESDKLLVFSQSPYAHRGSFDKTNSQFLTAPDYARSQTSSPFLCITPSPNIRRSSTSDIIDKKPAVSGSTVESRRPSTSDLLRRARERKGGDSGPKMGRSVSQGGLPRGGRMGRRTSMAF